METDDRLRRPGKGPILSSVAVHLVALAAVFWGQRSDGDPFEYVAYEMNFVTLGSEVLADELPSVPEPVVVDRTEAPPEPEPPEPVAEIPPPATQPEPTAEPEPDLPAPDAPPRSDPEPTPTAQAPAMDGSTSAAAMAVRMQGLRRDFPAYYSRILQEVDRCFRWNEPGGWTTIVRFEIQKDGRVSGSSIQLFTRSGNIAFDIAAASAVECAGMDRLGALPDDMPYDVLPVQFTFQPAQRGG